MIGAGRLGLALERYFRGRQAYKWVVRQWLELPDLDAASELLNTMRFTMNLRPQELDRPHGRSLAVIAPHPDDEIIGPGGTLMKAKSAGASIDVVYLPPRDGGEWGGRRTEAERACSESGFRARFLPSASGAAEGLAATMAELRPDVVFLPFVLDDHPDHREASRTLALAWAGAPWAPTPEVWAYQVYSTLLPNVIVDVTAVIERKKSAIRLYDSQMKRRDWAHFAAGLNAFNSRLKQNSPAACFIEAFFVSPMEDYLALCRDYLAKAKSSP